MDRKLRINLTQKNFDDFCEALNHRMTRIEYDIKWMKRIGYYMASIITAILITMLKFVFKVL